MLSIVSKDRMGWKTYDIGIFHGISFFYILPITYLCGRYSYKFDSRKILVISVFFTIIGILLGFDYTNYYETSKI